MAVVAAHMADLEKEENLSTTLAGAEEGDLDGDALAEEAGTGVGEEAEAGVVAVAAEEDVARDGSSLHQTVRSWTRSWRVIWREHGDSWIRRWILTWQTNRLGLLSSR